MTDMPIIRVRNRAELNELPTRDRNRAWVIICGGVVVKAREISGFTLGQRA